MACFLLACRLLANESGYVRDQNGVRTRIPGFGQTSTVEYLSNTHVSETEYFYMLAQALVTDPSLKYVRGDSLVGAPFDFRVVPQPDMLDTYMDNLRQLIEDTSLRNGNESCLLVSHSLGSTMVWFFLNRMSAAWKARYVRLWFAISPPLGGVVKTLRVVASGDNLGVFFVDRLTIRPLQRSMPSVAFLFPRTPYWNETETLVSTPRRNYSIADFQALMDDIGAPSQYTFWNNYSKLYDGLKAPQVETHCMYGTGIATPGFLYWSSQASFPDTYPSNLPDNGDGTVNLRSLRICSAFAAAQQQPVVTREFAYPNEDGEHLRILKNANLTSYILKVIKSISANLPPQPVLTNGIL